VAADYSSCESSPALRSRYRGLAPSLTAIIQNFAGSCKCFCRRARAPACCDWHPRQSPGPFHELRSAVHCEGSRRGRRERNARRVRSPEGRASRLHLR
jgi:hypothetical protein